MTQHPDKTFGLRSSTDLYLKLNYDIARLRKGGSTKAVQYSAFDCAVTGLHILDWVLNELDDVAHIRLTGVEKGKRGAVAGFIAKNDDLLGGLEYCRQIANSVKHMRITMGPVMQEMVTGSTVKLEWKEGQITDAYAISYIQVEKDGEKINVVDLFQTMARQWYDFLQEEGLWVHQPPDFDD